MDELAKQRLPPAQNRHSIVEMSPAAKGEPATGVSAPVVALVV